MCTRAFFRKCFKHALEVNAQAFSFREYYLSWRLYALGVRQLSYFRILIKQALVLKTQALLLESVSSMRLWRTLSFCVKLLRACA